MSILLPNGYRRGIRTVPSTNNPSASAAVTRQPAGATDALAFSTQPTVTVTPAVSGVVFTASIASGAGSLVGTVTATTNGSGVATWSDLGVNATTPPSSFTLQFVATGYPTVTTSSFLVVAAFSGTSAFPNEPTGSGWDRVVDYTWTQPPVEYMSGGVADNGSGLLNYLNTDVRLRWKGSTSGTFLSTVTDLTCPAASTVLKVDMPQDFYGMSISGEGAAVETPTNWRYRVNCPGGQSVFTFSWGETLPNTAVEVNIFPFPSGGFNWGNTSAVVTTTGLTVTFDTPPAAGTYFGIAAGWSSQGTLNAYSRDDTGPFTWPASRRGTGHIYFGYWHRTDADYTHYGSNGIRSVGSKNLFLMGTRGTLGAAAPLATNPVIIGSTRETEYETEMSCSSWTNQYSDSGNNDYRYFTFNNGNFSEGANSRNSLFQSEDGNWHLHEYIVQPNTFVAGVPQADGVMTYYMDGVLRSTSGGIVLWGTNAEPKWDSFGLANTYGGGFARCPQDQSMYYGPIRVAVR